MNEGNGIEGIWRIVKAELAGEVMPEFAAQQTEVELAAGHYTVRFAGEVRDRGTYALLATPTVKSIALSGIEGPNAGRTIPAIYQLVGDRLRICYGLNGEPPPAFAAPAQSQLFLVTYRRILPRS